MKLPNFISPSCGSLQKKKSANKRAYRCRFLLLGPFFCIAFLVGTPSFVNNNGKSVSLEWGAPKSTQDGLSTLCKSQCKPSGSEPLPKGIISRTSDLEMQPMNGSLHSEEKKHVAKVSRSLLAMAVGIRQKTVVNQIVEKFFSSNFSIMLCHYDGFVDGWRDLQWSNSALHVSAINQTKWWFAKRFLHPDIVAEYKYIFLWDEDLGVEHFDPGRYIAIIESEGLEISQPALDTAKSEVHHPITARWRKGAVHRRIYKLKGAARCYKNSTAPPCTGWVEMMAPVFSRAAWRCVWYMIQNDLIYAWGLDMKLGYCCQGDRTKNVGVVDSEYIVHMGTPTLGGFDENKSNADLSGHVSVSKSSYSGIMVPHRSAGVTDRFAIRRRSYAELRIFQRRWRNAATEDERWNDPYPEPADKFSR